MILQKIANGLRTQNWPTVVLELLVVVIAIFLGLQTDDWNEARKHRHQERVYLEKIRQDLISMQSELLHRDEEHAEAIVRMTAALRALEVCDDSAEAYADIRFALENYQRAPGINFQDATYNEMVASGALARIEDYRLKQEISYTFAELEQVNARIRNFRISMPIVDGIVWQHVAYSIDSETGDTVTDFRVADICEILEIRNSVVEMIDIQRDSRTTTERVLASVADLISLLEQQPAR